MLSVSCVSVLSGTTPPKGTGASARLRRPLLPSPQVNGLGLRHCDFSRPFARLLTLRPGDSLAILSDGFVDRLQPIRFPSWLLSKLRGLWLLPRRD